MSARQHEAVLFFRLPSLFRSFAPAARSRQIILFVYCRSHKGLEMKEFKTNKFKVEQRRNKYKHVKGNRFYIFLCNVTAFKIVN